MKLILNLIIIFLNMSLLNVKLISKLRFLNTFLDKNRLHGSYFFLITLLKTINSIPVVLKQSRRAKS